MLRRAPLLLLIYFFAGHHLHAQDLAGIEIHGFATQGFLFSSHNNYLTMRSSSGSLQWTDGAVSVTDSLTDNLRVGIQLHMYELGQLGGPNIQVDWASGDYRVNDYFGIRAGKVKTPLGLFNDSQDVDAIFLWILLPQGAYPIDNKDFFLAPVGGEVYGTLPLGDRAGKVLYRGYAGYNQLDTRGGYIQSLYDAGIAFKNPPGGKTYGGDLRWQTPLTGLTLGASELVQALDGTSPTGGLHVPPAPVIAEYGQFSRGKFYIAGEYRRQTTNATLTFASVTYPSPTDERIWYMRWEVIDWQRSFNSEATTATTWMKTMEARGSLEIIPKTGRSLDATTLTFIATAKWRATSYMERIWATTRARIQMA